MQQTSLSFPLVSVYMLTCYDSQSAAIWPLKGIPYTYIPCITIVYEVHCSRTVCSYHCKVFADSLSACHPLGVKTLVSISLSVIVRSEEVMSKVSSLPPKLQTQIKAAYNAHKCNIPHPAIEHLSL